MFFMTINKFKPGTSPAAIGKVIPPHITWIKEQIASGTIVQAGKWGNGGGMAIIRASDLSEAEAILSKDPLVKSGLITFELAQFYPDVEIR